MKQIFVIAILAVSSGFLLASDGPKNPEDLSIELSDTKAVQADYRSVSLSYSLSHATRHSVQSPRSISRHYSPEPVLGSQEHDHAYWVRAWATLCEKAHLDREIESIGSNALSKIRQQGEQLKHMRELKSHLHSVHDGDQNLQHAKVSGDLARAVGTPRSQESIVEDQQLEEENQKNVDTALQILIKLLAKQNSALDAQVAILRQVADSARAEAAASAQTIALKEQELAQVQEDQVQQRRDRCCARGWKLLGALSGTVNVVLAALLARSSS